MYFLYNFLSQTLKRFQTLIESCELRFLAEPSTDKSFKMTIRIYSYQNLMKNNHPIQGSRSINRCKKAFNSYIDTQNLSEFPDFSTVNVFHDSGHIVFHDFFPFEAFIFICSALNLGCKRVQTLRRSHGCTIESFLGLLTTHPTVDKENHRMTWRNNPKLVLSYAVSKIKKI